MHITLALILSIVMNMSCNITCVKVSNKNLMRNKVRSDKMESTDRKTIAEFDDKDRILKASQKQPIEDFLSSKFDGLDLNSDQIKKIKAFSSKLDKNSDSDFERIVAKFFEKKLKESKPLETKQLDNLVNSVVDSPLMDSLLSNLKKATSSVKEDGPLMDSLLEKLKKATSVKEETTQEKFEKAIKQIINKAQSLQSVFKYLSKSFKTFNLKSSNPESENSANEKDRGNNKLTLKNSADDMISKLVAIVDSSSKSSPGKNLLSQMVSTLDSSLNSKAAEVDNLSNMVQLASSFNDKMNSLTSLNKMFGTLLKMVTGLSKITPMLKSSNLQASKSNLQASPSRFTSTMPTTHTTATRASVSSLNDINSLARFFKSIVAHGGKGGSYEGEGGSGGRVELSF